VGYGNETSRKGVVTDFWFAQSTWGTAYGEDGYFKIVRGKNLCNIASDALSPVIKPPLPVQLRPIRTPSVCSRTGDVMRKNIVEKSFCIIESVWIE
jgi:hypothetical protein